MISNTVIEHKKKLDRSILEENKQTEKKDILFYKYPNQIRYQGSIIYKKTCSVSLEIYTILSICYIIRIEDSKLDFYFIFSFYLILILILFWTWGQGLV